MANLSDLQLLNEAGETKSTYSLIAEHTEAITRVNNKTNVEASTSGVLTIEPLDGSDNFLDPTSGDIHVTMPIAAESNRFKIFVKNIGGIGLVKLKFDVADLVDGAASADIVLAAGDCIEIVCGGSTGYWTKYKIA